ncbi:N-acetyltransferase GCN5 [Sphingopyxis bauzanensis]|nr:N-acetyltransferase GCN5 [Sphingopyxis bauzanensis]
MIAQSVPYPFPELAVYRPMRSLGQIRALTFAAYAKWVGVTPRPPRPVTADYDRAFRDHRFDLLVEGGKLVAFIETVAEGAELLIVNVAVDLARQRKGLGIRLMRHAEAVARAAGLQGTRLTTNKLMATNIVHYERLGYTEEREADHSGGMVAVHMALRFAP